MEEANELPATKVILLLVMLALSYFILYMLSAAREEINKIPFLNLILVLPQFESLMFWIMPLVSFFVIFFLVDWVNAHFETKLALSPVFPVIYFLLCLGAFFFALYWYMSNFAQLQQVELPLDQIDWWGRLHMNAFMFFAWGGVFGWIARFAMDKIKLEKTQSSGEEQADEEE